MKIKKISVLFIVVFSCAFFLASNAELFAKAASKKTVAKSHKTTAHKKTKVKAKAKPVAEKSSKEIDSEKGDVKEKEISFEQPAVSPSVAQALQNGDLSGALIALRDEKPSSKVLYLTREVSRITSFLVSKKPDRSEAHKIYQNIGVAYHNLYLFLKARGTLQKDFIKEAMKYYDKARGPAIRAHKDEIDLLVATLLAASGDKEKAGKKFSKLKEATFMGEFDTIEYLAAYYAAIGDAAKSAEMLYKAHELSPDMARTWLAIGDDFYFVKDSPEFKTLLVTWKAADVGKKLVLSLPKSKKAKIKTEDDETVFRPQKIKEHYDIKKHKKTKSVAKKSVSKKTSTKAKPTSKTHKKSEGTSKKLFLE